MSGEKYYGKADLYRDLDKFIRETPYNADTRPVLDDIYSTRLRFNRDSEIEKVIKAKKAHPGRNVLPEDQKIESKIVKFAPEDFEKKTEQTPALGLDTQSKTVVDEPAPAKDATVEMKILDYYTSTARGDARGKDLNVFRSELFDLGIKVKGKPTFDTLWKALEDKFNEINQ